MTGTSPATVPAARVRPGDGIVARTGEGFLVMLPGGAAATVATLLDTFTTACRHPRPGLHLVRQLAYHLAAAEPASTPALAAGAATADGFAVLVHGDIELQATGVGNLRLSGRDSPTWSDRILPGPLSQVEVAATARGGAQERGPFDLRDGVVPGSGLLLCWEDETAWPSPVREGEHRPDPDPVRRSDAVLDGEAGTVEPPLGRVPPPPPAAPRRPEDAGSGTRRHADGKPGVAAADELRPPELQDRAPELGRDEDVEIELLDAAEAEVGPADPLPVLTGEGPQEEAPAAEDEDAFVDGIVCRNNHFNHPQALYCASCGVHMVHVTQVSVRRRRPSLGVVVLDDGTTFALDGDYVVGRMPERDERVRDGSARPLRLLQDSVSRAHAAIELREWDVVVRDLDSSNGTYLSSREAPQWRRLSAREPVVLKPGMRVAFGSRVMLFETHHQIGA